MSYTDDFNATCPYCGQDTLVATVMSRDAAVPLRPDGYDPTEGEPIEAELESIRCTGCGKGVPAEHASHTENNGWECDCNQTIPRSDFNTIPGDVAARDSL